MGNPRLVLLPTGMRIQILQRLRGRTILLVMIMVLLVLSTPTLLSASQQEEKCLQVAWVPSSQPLSGFKHITKLSPLRCVISTYSPKHAQETASKGRAETQSISAFLTTVRLKRTAQETDLHLCSEAVGGCVFIKQSKPSQIYRPLYTSPWF